MRRFGVAGEAPGLAVIVGGVRFGAYSDDGDEEKDGDRSKRAQAGRLLASQPRAGWRRHLVINGSRQPGSHLCLSAGCKFATTRRLSLSVIL